MLMGMCLRGVDLEAPRHKSLNIHVQILAFLAEQSRSSFSLLPYQLQIGLNIKLVIVLQKMS